MNFKRLKNEKEYKNTKRLLEKFIKEKDELEKQFPDLASDEYKLFAKPVLDLVLTLMAEVTVYEKENNLEGK